MPEVPVGVHLYRNPAQARDPDQAPWLAPDGRHRDRGRPWGSGLAAGLLAAAPGWAAEQRLHLAGSDRAGRGDAFCCPGELADLAWTLAGEALVPVAATTGVARLTVAALAGPEWVLSAWDADQPADAMPEI